MPRGRCWAVEVPWCCGLGAVELSAAAESLSCSGAAVGPAGIGLPLRLSVVAVVLCCCCAIGAVLSIVWVALGCCLTVVGVSAAEVPLICCWGVPATPAVVVLLGICSELPAAELTRDCCWAGAALMATAAPSSLTWQEGLVPQRVLSS